MYSVSLLFSCRSRGLFFKVRFANATSSTTGPNKPEHVTTTPKQPQTARRESPGYHSANSTFGPHGSLGRARHDVTRLLRLRRLVCTSHNWPTGPYCALPDPTRQYQIFPAPTSDNSSFSATKGLSLWFRRCALGVRLRGRLRVAAPPTLPDPVKPNRARPHEALLASRLSQKQSG